MKSKIYYYDSSAAATGGHLVGSNRPNRYTCFQRAVYQPSNTAYGIASIEVTADGMVIKTNPANKAADFLPHMTVLITNGSNEKVKGYHRITRVTTDSIIVKSPTGLTEGAIPNATQYQLQLASIPTNINTGSTRDISFQFNSSEAGALNYGFGVYDNDGYVHANAFFLKKGYTTYNQGVGNIGSGFWPNTLNFTATSKTRYWIIGNDRFIYMVANIGDDLTKPSVTVFAGDLISPVTGDPLKENFVLCAAENYNSMSAAGNAACTIRTGTSVMSSVDPNLWVATRSMSSNASGMNAYMVAPAPGISSTGFMSGNTLFKPQNDQYTLLPVSIIDRAGYDRGRVPGLYYIKEYAYGVFTHGSIVKGYGDLANRDFLVVYSNYNSIVTAVLPQMATPQQNVSVYLIDITGPWE